MSDHIGRSFDGHPLEDACPCPQEPCGLVAVSRIDPACPQHALAAGKTIRQSHTAERCPMTEQTITTTTAPEHMTMWWDETLWLPFVESESCDITGPGHQDPKVFARLVTHYDCTATGDSKAGKTDAADVHHRWIIATVDAGGEWTCRAVPAGTPGAIPVTTVWGSR